MSFPGPGVDAGTATVNVRGGRSGQARQDGHDGRTGQTDGRADGRTGGRVKAGPNKEYGIEAAISPVGHMTGGPPFKKIEAGSARIGCTPADHAAETAPAEPVSAKAAPPPAADISEKAAPAEPASADISKTADPANHPCRNQPSRNHPWLRQVGGNLPGLVRGHHHHLHHHLVQ